MNLGLTESLPSLVSRRFVAAKESGNLIFSATQLAVLRSKHGIDYQLRYCPALAKKPGSENHSSTKKPSSSGPKPDPFENPSPDLLITEVPFLEKSHFLVLNKFPVIPNHFILATKRFESQTDLLEKEDLGVAYACLEAWVDDVPPENNEIKGNGEKGRRRLFAFFNSGEESGASQPHRHLQFLPIEDMRAQQGEENSGAAAEGGSGSWTPLIDLFLTSSNVQTSSSGIRHLPNLPFQHFALQIPRSSSSSSSSSSESSSPSADALHEMYLSLYRAALLSAGITTPNEQMRTSGPAAISYNLAMTEDIMMIVPRKKETATIPDLPDAGAVSLNGTILAGTLMVKTEEQWDHLRKDAEVINDLFAEVGISV